LLLVAALVASLAKQLTVLLLRHALAALLDDRTHGKPHYVRGLDAGVRARERADERKMPRISLADVGDRPMHGIGHRGLRHTIAASEPHRRKLTGMHEPVHGHLGDAHQLSDLRDREKSHVGQLCHSSHPSPAWFWYPQNAEAHSMVSERVM